jgi:hypothetical protein
MKRKFEVIATVGNYTDQATGKKVKRTLPVGAIYESTNGKLVLRLDAIPVATEFSGWMQLRPCSPELPPGRRLPPGMPAAPEDQPGEDPDSDVPF